MEMWNFLVVKNPKKKALDIPDYERTWIRGLRKRNNKITVGVNWTLGSHYYMANPYEKRGSKP